MAVWARAESAKEGEVLESMVEALFLITWNGVLLKREKDSEGLRVARKASVGGVRARGPRTILRTQHHSGICSRRAQWYPPALGLRDVSE
jgi:hypothetical protein